MSSQMLDGITSKKRRPIEYKWIVSSVVVFGTFMSILDQTIVNTAIPKLQIAFGADLHSIQWIITAYTLALAMVTPTMVFLSDRLGTKRSFLGSLLLFTLGSALCGLSWNLPSLIVFRIIQGIGGAGLFPLATTLLFNEFPMNQRGRAGAILGIAALLGPTIGPTLGGYLVTYQNWRLIFYINVPLGIIAFTLALLFLRKGEAEKRQRFDIMGFVSAAGGLSLLLYGLSETSVEGWSSWQVLIPAGSGLGMLALFVLIELYLVKRKRTPLLHLDIFANGPFVTSNIASALNTFSFFGGIILFTIYMQDIRGLSALEAGLYSIPQAIASLLAGLACARVVDRFGPKIVIIPGLLLMVLSTWQFTYVTLNTSFVWISVLFAIRGIGLGLTIQPLSVAAIAEIPPQRIGLASTLNTAIRYVFTSLGIAILTTLFQARIQDHVQAATASITPGSYWANILIHIEAGLRQQGISAAIAHVQAMTTLQQMIAGQASVDALHDTLWLTLVISSAAFIVACLIRRPRASTTHTATENREAALPILMGE